MKDQRKTEIRVGLTVIVGILLLIWIFGWAKNLSIRASEQDVTVVFENVSGLEVGDPVTVNGLRKGYVNTMQVRPNQILVELYIDNDVQLKEDASFSISMLDLMGGKKVEVFPGSSDKELDLDKTYTGKFLSDIPAVMSVFGSVQDDLIQVLKDVKISLASMNNYLTDEKFSSDLKQSVSNLNVLTQQMNSLIRENKENINSLTKSTTELVDKTNRILGENEENIKQLFADLENVLTKSNKLLSDLNSITEETKQQQNNIGKILYDEEFLTNLKQTLQQANELTSILIEQLKGDGVNVNADIF